MFNTIKDLLKSRPLDEKLKRELFVNYIKIRDTNEEEYSFLPEDDLYLLFNKKNDTRLQRECNGLILEKDTNRVVAACQTDFENEFPIDFENYISAEYCEDGTVIRLYNHKGIWTTCTKKCINAKTSHWCHVKSFNDMFWEVFGNSRFDIKTLDNNCTYIFTLLHIDNVLVVKHCKNSLVYLGTVNNITGNESNDFNLFKCNENIHPPTQVKLTRIDLQLIYETYTNKTVRAIVDQCVGTDSEMTSETLNVMTSETLNEMTSETLNEMTSETLNEMTSETLNEMTSETLDNYQMDNVISESKEKRYDNYVSKYFNPKKRGIILKFTGNRMFKIDFNEFEYMQRIRGNEPLIRNRYLELLNDEHSLRILLTYYSEHYFTFSMIRHNIMVVCNDIFVLYRNTHIKHLTKIDESHLYFRTIKQLHGQYKRTNVPITRIDVYNKLKTYNVFLLKKLLRWNN